MTALELLKDYPFLPSSKEGAGLGRPSGSELRRWLTKGSVLINGETPKPSDEIEYPISQLQFFPQSKFRTTLIWEVSNAR